MKKKYLGIPLYWFLVVFGIAILFMIFGSFFDKPISDALACSSNPFAMFCESYGLSFGYCICSMGGVLAWVGLYKRKNIWARILGWVLLIASMGIMSYLLGDFIFRNPASEVIQYGYLIGDGVNDAYRYLAYGVAFLINVFFGLIIYLCVDKSEKNFNRLLRIGLIMIAAMIIQYLCQHFLKIMAGRPRWRFLYELDGTWDGVPYSFENWWEFAFFKNPDNEYFKSFPSGHTCTAATALTLALLPPVLKKNFKHSTLILGLVGLLYTLVIAFSRILAGAHFLSDLGGALLVGSLVVFLCVYIGSFIKKDKDKIPDE